MPKPLTTKTSTDYTSRGVKIQPPPKITWSPPPGGKK
jgi:hypothetical protein